MVTPKNVTRSMNQWVMIAQNNHRGQNFLRQGAHSEAARVLDDEISRQKVLHVVVSAGESDVLELEQSVQVPGEQSWPGEVVRDIGLFYILEEIAVVGFWVVYQINGYVVFAQILLVFSRS